MDFSVVCADFHELVYDLLKKCVAGDLGVDDAAAFFTDLTSNLVSLSLCESACVMKRASFSAGTPREPSFAVD